MGSLFTSMMFGVVGVIHLLPVAGVMGGSRLKQLYGLPFAHNDAQVLMRHRAVLFGLLGSLFVYAAFDSSVQTLAWVMASVSVVSFLVLAKKQPSSPALGKVVVADCIALLALGGIAVQRFLQ